MDRIVEFIGNNWLLFVALLVILVLLALDFLKDLNKAFKSVPPADATRLINREDAVVLDIRNDKDYEEGHILNAVHVPAGLLESKMDKLEKYKDRPVIVSCRSGQQSYNSCNILAKNGFQHIYNLKGGMMAWQNANLPVTKT